MNYPHLLKAIDAANRQLVGRAAVAVNQALVVRNWMIGAHLVELEQAGADRAKYGKRLLETLAHDLAGRGLKALDDPRLLRDCRTLYFTYPQIRGTLSRELIQAVPLAIRGPVTPELPELPREPSPSTKQKTAVVRRQKPQETVEDLLRDPYVLEFTGLAERPEYQSRMDLFVGACLQAIPSPDRLQAGSYGKHRAFALLSRQQSPIASLRLSRVEGASAPSRRPAVRKARSSAKRSR